MSCFKFFFKKKKQTNAAAIPTVAVRKPTPDIPPRARSAAEEKDSIFELSDEENDPVLDNVTLTSSGYATEVTDPNPPPVEERRETPPEDEKDLEVERIHRDCPQFRVLVIGKANSGKTTIIQKICDAEELEVPIVRDKEGNQLDPSILQDPDAMRGIHDVELQITYSSNPGFIFHDSMGFEAGSTDELEKVRKFIAEKLAQDKLQDRLHVIWYCVPTDGTRVASSKELMFFEENTGNIPVIAVFTKWDGQIVKACNALQQEGMKLREAKKAAPAYAEETFKNHFLPVFNETPFPPKRHLRLGNMDKKETKCRELSDETTQALDNDVLKKLFLTVQSHNIQLRVEAALKQICEDIFAKRTLKRRSAIVVEVISWFPHLWCSFDYDLGWGNFGQYGWFGQDQGNKGRKRFPPLFKPIFAISKEEFEHPHQQIIHTIIATVVIAQGSFTPNKPRRARAGVKPTVRKYTRSPQRQEVKKAILERFPNGVSANEAMSAKDAMVEICVNNLLGVHA